MSVWTHVAGLIRIDVLRFEDINYIPIIEESLKKTFGEVFGFNDEWPDEETIKNSKIPWGSEGTLKYIITENPYKSSMAAFDVIIKGDLRDYDDLDYIIEWFKNGLKDFSVRQAVITVNDGWSVKTWDNKSDTLVEKTFE